MTKKTLLTTLIVLGCLLGAGEMRGQTITIGSETTTNQNLPSFSNSNYSLSEQIYTATEISNAGGYLGNITSIVFYNNSYSNKTRNFDIYLVHTSQTSFSSTTNWISVAAENRVYSGSVTLASRAWTSIVFDSPFTWNGSSNIALIIDDNTGSQEYGLGSYVFDASAQSLYVQGSSDISPIDPASSGTIGDIKNMIKLEFESASSCSKPSNLNCTNLNSNAATFDWSENGTADTWQVVYSTDPDFAPNSETPITVTSKPYTLRGLTAETTYYAYVRAYCDAENQSAWSNKCEFRPSANVTHTINDDTKTFANIPFYYNVANSNIKSQFIIPSSDLTSMKGGKIHKLTFYTSSSTANYGDATFDVYLAEVASTTLSSYYDWDSNALTKVYSGSLSVSSNQMMVSLSTPYNYQGGNLMIGFNMTSVGTSPGYVYWYCAESIDACCRYNTGYSYENTNKYLPKTTFTYTPAITFATAGNWNVTDNWYGNVPSSTDNVLISAAVTIPNSCVAQANNIVINGGSVTIQDGGQLICNNNPTVTAQKSISAYTIPSGQGTTNGWYFIASPLSSDYTPATPMTSNTYDLYRLDPSTSTWENFKNSEDHPDFTKLTNGKGYLYANSNATTLAFTGAIKASAASATVDVTAGWNLIGNPFTYNTYVNCSYYKMNDDRNAVESVASYQTNPVAPCTGVVVKANEAGNVTFSKNPPVSGVNSNILMMLAQTFTTRDGASSSTILDNAIVSFNEGNQLEKFYFGKQNANLYIPQGTEEYAIVNAEAQGEMPVNFKANENGQYTLTVNTEGVEMNYLHLIDNMTGADIDLLLTPSYTFNAKTYDYESRFRLVFAANEGASTGSATDATFAYIDANGYIIVNGGPSTPSTGSGTEGSGTSILQVIDVLGHQLLTKELQTSYFLLPTSSLPAGVYVLRLVNGNNTKTQKIVVR